MTEPPERSRMWLAILVALAGITAAGLLLLLGQSPAPTAPAQDPAAAVRNASPLPPLTFAPVESATSAPPTSAQLTRRRVAVTPTG